MGASPDLCRVFAKGGLYVGLDWSAVGCLSDQVHTYNVMVLTDVSWPQPMWRWKLENCTSVSMQKSTLNASKSKRALWYNSFVRTVHFMKYLK